MDQNLKSQFSRTIEENKQRILRICRAYATTFEDQQDLFQEVALNIWKSLPSFRNEAMMNTWVYRICLNVCMQHALKFNRSKLSHTPIEGIKILDDSADLDKNLEKSEKTKILYKCISMLDNLDKTLILLFLEDLSYKEISAIAGITENHVAVKINRIKTKLFNCINK